MQTRVLFVCHANVCRSPLAQAIFVDMVRRRGLSDAFHVDSAGTWGMDGASPHPLSIDTAARHGIDLAAFDRVARSIAPEDLERFDQLLVMDRRNLADLDRLVRMSALRRVEGRDAKIRLLRRVDDPTRSGADVDVPDPIGRGPAEFDHTFAILDRACQALLAELIAAPRAD